MLRRLRKNPEEQLLDVIRGKAPIAELATLGVEIKDLEGALMLQSGLPGDIIRPSVNDILQGLRSHIETLSHRCDFLLCGNSSRLNNGVVL
jgi:hypothetical protein